MNSKDLKRLLREAERKGWRVEQRRKHYQAKHMDGVRLVTISLSPSDHRALQNIRKDLEL